MAIASRSVILTLAVRSVSLQWQRLRILVLRNSVLFGPVVELGRRCLGNSEKDNQCVQRLPAPDSAGAPHTDLSMSRAALAP